MWSILLLPHVMYSSIRSSSGWYLGRHLCFSTGTIRPSFFMWIISCVDPWSKYYCWHFCCIFAVFYFYFHLYFSIQHSLLHLYSDALISSSCSIFSLPIYIFFYPLSHYISHTSFLHIIFCIFCAFTHPCIVFWVFSPHIHFHLHFTTHPHFLIFISMIPYLFQNASFIFTLCILLSSHILTPPPFF